MEDALTVIISHNRSTIELRWNILSAILLAMWFSASSQRVLKAS